MQLDKVTVKIYTLVSPRLWHTPSVIYLSMFLPQTVRMILSKSGRDDAQRSVDVSCKKVQACNETLSIPVSHGTPRRLSLAYQAISLPGANMYLAPTAITAPAIMTDALKAMPCV